MHIFDSFPTFLGAAAVLPAVLILWLVASADRRPEPASVVWLTFALGVGAIFLLHYVKLPLAWIVHLAKGPWSAVILHAIFDVAIPEEAVKIAVIGFVVCRHRPFEEPMDGVVYGAAAGLGFAAYENLSYLARSPDEWQMLAVTRNVLTVPFHAALGAIAGTFIEMARLSYRRGHGRIHQVRYSIYACLVPVAWHALFDTPLMMVRYNVVRGSTQSIAHAGGIAIGVAAIACAVWIAYHLHEQQKPLARAGFEQWQRSSIWLTATAGAGLFGAALIASSLHAWLYAGEMLALDSLGVGLALVGTALYSCHCASCRLNPGPSARSA